MNNSKRVVVVRFLMIFITGLIQSTCALAATPPTFQRIDKPDELMTLNFTPKITVLVFFKPDCADCRASLQDAQSIANAYVKDFETVGVYESSWPTYAEKGGVQAATQMRQIHDAGFRLSKAYGVAATPTWVAVSGGGQVMGRAVTKDERQKLTAQIKMILEGKTK